MLLNTQCVPLQVHSSYLWPKPTMRKGPQELLLYILPAVRCEIFMVGSSTDRFFYMNYSKYPDLHCSVPFEKLVMTLL